MVSDHQDDAQQGRCPARTKKQKKTSRIQDKHMEQEEAESCLRDRDWNLQGGSHPCGVLPWGNSYHPSAAPSIRNTSLGRFRVFGDESLLDILGIMEAKDLCKLARTSKAFYILAHTDDLWKTLVLTNLGGNFRFERTWRETYAKEACGVKSGSLSQPRRFEGYYSDLLFQPWLCSSLEFDEAW